MCQEKEILKLEKSNVTINYCSYYHNLFVSDEKLFEWQYILLLLGERSSEAMQEGFRDSLGWHLIEMAGTSHIPWGSTPMYIVLGIRHYMLKYITLLNKVH